MNKKQYKRILYFITLFILVGTYIPRELINSPPPVELFFTILFFVLLIVNGAAIPQYFYITPLCLFFADIITTEIWNRGNFGPEKNLGIFGSFLVFLFSLFIVGISALISFIVRKIWISLKKNQEA